MGEAATFGKSDGEKGESTTERASVLAARGAASDSGQRAMMGRAKGLLEVPQPGLQVAQEADEDAFEDIVRSVGNGILQGRFEAAKESA